MGDPNDFLSLPKNLPIPVDDGACAHLPGLPVPAIALPSTAGQQVYLAELSQKHRVIVYCYPRTGRPGHALPEGWDSIPGARGCTPQACGFRNHFSELQARNTLLFGLSTQTTAYQQELVARLLLPFAMLSDSQHALIRALKLPVFLSQGEILVKRLTLVLQAGKIENVFYPVFPPDLHAEEVLAWLDATPNANQTEASRSGFSSSGESL